MSEDSSIELTDLYFELRPKSRPKDGASMIESMWSSMSSSMQLAKDCLEHEGNSGGGTAGAQNPPMEGLERFAQIIDNGKYAMPPNKFVRVNHSLILLCSQF